MSTLKLTPLNVAATLREVLVDALATKTLTESERYDIEALILQLDPIVKTCVDAEKTYGLNSD